MPSISIASSCTSEVQPRAASLPRIFCFSSKVLALGRIVGRRGVARPFLAVGMHQPQIAHVVAGHTARRPVAKLSVDILFPQLRRLHDMHVAVDDVESVLCHKSPHLLELYISSMSILLLLCQSASLAVRQTDALLTDEWVAFERVRLPRSCVRADMPVWLRCKKCRAMSDRRDRHRQGICRRASQPSAAARYDCCCHGRG